MKNILRTLVGFLSLLLTANSVANSVVIGYLPSYKGLNSNIDNVQFSKLTHLNIAFLNADKQGDFIKNAVFTCMNTKHAERLTAQELQHSIDKAHKGNVKVLLSIGGALMPKCAGNWRELFSTKKRERVINNLVRLVEDFNLDGLDIDLESELLTNLIKDENYVVFVKKLSEKLKSKNKLLTAATGSYIGGMIPIGSLPYFDYVSVMSYDAVGPYWGTPGVEHSTIENANRDLLLWKKRGVEKSKLILGLPFYGYGFGKYQANYSIREIAEIFGAQSLNQDVIGEVCLRCDHITFNGRPTIIDKTKLAMKLGGGVMIWELSHDLKSENSLLSTVNETIKDTQ